MSAANRRGLWAIIALGVAVRLALALATDGVEFDMASYEIVRAALRDGPLELYAEVNGDLARWPYPPGFLGWIALLDEGTEAFRTLVRLPMIAADAAIAWLVQDFLGRRGAAERVRLAAAALVALGPSFFAVSGHHGQVDSVAILPAVAALWAWERPGTPRRAVVCGLLVGAGAAVKTVPLLLLLALVPAARSRREAATLAACALAVPLVLLAPFLAAEPEATFDALRYRGVPGSGGISLLVQPGLAEAPLVTGVFAFNGVSEWLYEHGSLVTLPLLAAAGALLAWRRPAAATGAVIVWLTVLAFGVNLLLQYFVWALPFLLMAGHVWRVALLQAALAPATLIVYLAPWETTKVLWVYSPLMIAIWAALVAWLAAEVTAVARGGEASPRAAPPSPPRPRPPAPAAR